MPRRAGQDHPVGLSSSWYRALGVNLITYGSPTGITVQSEMPTRCRTNWNGSEESAVSHDIIWQLHLASTQCPGGNEQPAEDVVL